MLALTTPIAASAVLFVAQTTRTSSVTEPTTPSGLKAVIATAIIGYVWQAFRDWRDRKWRLDEEAKRANREKQDAEYKAADIAAKAEIARLAKENQELVAKLADEARKEIGRALAENTDLTKQVFEIGKQGVDLNKEAIKAGNNFNNKFAAVMQQQSPGA